jgi:hypothetical protein
MTMMVSDRFTNRIDDGMNIRARVFVRFDDLIVAVWSSHGWRVSQL